MTDRRPKQPRDNGLSRDNGFSRDLDAPAPKRGDRPATGVVIAPAKGPRLGEARPLEPETQRSADVRGADGSGGHTTASPALAAWVMRESVRTSPPPPDVEEVICAALAAGDVGKALHHASEHYRAPLVRFAMAFVNDAIMAEDIAQTAFAIATERASQFAHASTFRTWLFGIARHKALDAAAARHGVPLSQVTDSRWLMDAIGPATGLQLADDLKLLDQVVATMSDDTRALLQLRFREELSYKEIAATFEISEEAARKRMFDALERLRKALERARSGFLDK